MAIRPTRLRATVLATALFLIGFGAWPISAEPVHRFRVRSLPATAIEPAELDPIPESAWPRSEIPAGAVAFVSCTRLWSALPDGSGRRPIVQMEGISSPTFAPDARTIAFLVDGRELWMAAADGSTVRRVGSFGLPPFAEARGLTWSPKGERLAFAVVTPAHDPWVDGSAVWTLDLETGAYVSHGVGWEAPFWAVRKLGMATRDPHVGSRFSIEGAERFSAALSSASGDLTAALTPRDHVALRRSSSGDPELLLVTRRGLKREATRRIAPPPGFSFPETSRLAMAREGTLVAADLVSAHGERAVGLLDVATRSWSVSEDAWEPALGPAPLVLGPIGARRASLAAGTVLRAGSSPTQAASLLAGRRDVGLPFPGRVSALTGVPRRLGGGWLVPATVHGPITDGYGYVEASVRVHENRGRLVAEPVAVSPIRRIATVEQSLVFLGRTVGVETRPIEGLPDGTRLDPHWPVEAWRWRGEGFGSVRLDLPGTGLRRGFVEVGFGDVAFSMGCGMPEEIEPTEVGGTPALVGRLGDTHQVVWPASPDDEETARFSVYGDVPEETILAIARSMA